MVNLYDRVHTTEEGWVSTSGVAMMNFRELLAKFWVVTPIPTLTYTTRYFNPFNNASWNFGIQAPILFSVLGDYFGARGNMIVYGTIFVTIIGLYWIRTESAAIPLFMMFILSNVFFFTPGLFPTDWLWLITDLEYLVLAGIAYTYFKGRGQPS